MAKSKVEPFWWSLFSAGGMVAAMVTPVLMVITGIAVPFGLAGDGALAFERASASVANPIVKLVLFVLVSLPLFHGAHRILFTLVDVGLRRVSRLLSVLCYGGAIAGTLSAAIVLWRL